VTDQPLPSPPRRVAGHTVALTKVYGSGDAEVRALDDVTTEPYAAEFTAPQRPGARGDRPSGRRAGRVRRACGRPRSAGGGASGAPGRPADVLQAIAT